MGIEKLKQILDRHSAWVITGGMRGEKANLRGADLRGAKLDDADLRGADLSDANLSDANLRGAKLDDAKYNSKTAFYAMCCPEEGEFIGYKKAHRSYNMDEYCIVELKICADAKRSSATTRKCRCSKAEVLSITSIDGERLGCNGISDYYTGFEYKVGEIVQSYGFCEDRWKECAEGIHFFITRDEAVQYKL